MPRAHEVDEVSPGILIWQTYDAKIRADLFSTALTARAGTYIVDPIPLASDGLRSLREQPEPAGIFVTNVNHLRAAPEFARALSLPIFAQGKLTGTPDFPRVTAVQDGEEFSRGLTAIALDGGPVGEMALHYDDNGGTLVLGDALINFEPHGFRMLPAKYCEDASQLRQSLAKLLNYAFERMLFAHGTPILSGARAHLEQLLGRKA
jgi:glyoxylase-like metal-dependent hydrolase (beta-lactamase superfamily II)